MYKQVPPALLLLASLALGPAALAIEPDGRVAFRTAWLDAKDGSAPRLQITMTAVSPLTGARLVAKVPEGIGLSSRGANGLTALPLEGIAIGTLAAGETFVVEFEVAKPDRGGDIVSFTLEASSQGRVVTEGVGVPVGVPGTEPKLRNGAVEFTALQLEGKR